jgi:hypothetical protein
VSRNPFDPTGAPPGAAGAAEAEADGAEGDPASFGAGGSSTGAIGAFKIFGAVCAIGVGACLSAA